MDIQQGDKFGIICDNITSPIPAMRAAGLIDFNCWILFNDGTWHHISYIQADGGGYAHADEGDGGYAAREAEAAWGSL